jgi:hypothetical protein
MNANSYCFFSALCEIDAVSDELFVHKTPERAEARRPGAGAGVIHAAPEKHLQQPPETH